MLLKHIITHCYSSTRLSLWIRTRLLNEEAAPQSHYSMWLLWSIAQHSFKTWLKCHWATIGPSVRCDQSRDGGTLPLGLLIFPRDLHGNSPNRDRRTQAEQAQKLCQSAPDEPVPNHICNWPGASHQMLGHAPQAPGPLSSLFDRVIN